MADARFFAQGLERFAFERLTKAGLDAASAEATVRTLVEGDPMGHDMHGLASKGKRRVRRFPSHRQSACSVATRE